jgi:hypothetical protein
MPIHAGKNAARNSATAAWHAELPYATIVLDVSSTRHYVFVQVSINHVKQTLHVVALGHYARPID